MSLSHYVLWDTPINRKFILCNVSTVDLLDLWMLLHPSYIFLDKFSTTSYFLDVLSCCAHRFLYYGLFSSTSQALWFLRVTSQAALTIFELSWLILNYYLSWTQAAVYWACVGIVKVKIFLQADMRLSPSYFCWSCFFPTQLLLFTHRAISELELSSTKLLTSF